MEADLPAAHHAEYQLSDFFLKQKRHAPPPNPFTGHK